MDNILIGIIIALIVIAFMVAAVIFVLTFYYLHHGFSSGSWFNKKGDVVVIRNTGILGDSQLKIAARNGSTYDMVKYNCKMFINPLSPPHKFTLYIRGEDKLKAVINMINGKMKLYKDGKFYDEFAKSNCSG